MSDTKENIPPSVGDDASKVREYQFREASEADARFQLDGKVEALKAWQASEHVHPLTCGECPGKMQPLKKGGQVILVCPDCGWSQPEDHIPSVCFQGPPMNLADRIQSGTVADVSMGCLVAPPEPCSICQGRTERGLYGKFTVGREDGRDLPGRDRERADYFVLDLTFDPFAIPALRAYADACEGEYPALAADLRKKLAEQTGG